MLSARDRRRLVAVVGSLVPSGGPIEVGADELDLAATIIDDVGSYPPRALRRTRLLLFAIEHMPLVMGSRRRFTRLDLEGRTAFLSKAAHHRWALWRLVVSYLKQLCYSAFISERSVEEVVGYDYRCLRPRPGVPDEGQTHR